MKALLDKYYAINLARSQILQDDLNRVSKITDTLGISYVLRRIEKSPYKTNISFNNEFLVLEKFLKSKFNLLYYPIACIKRPHSDNLMDKYVISRGNYYYNIFSYVENSFRYKDSEKLNIPNLIKNVVNLHENLYTLNNVIRDTTLYSTEYLKDFFSNGTGYFEFFRNYDGHENIIKYASKETLSLLDKFVKDARKNFIGTTMESFTEQVIHGDLRPENMLFDKNGKILAFIDFETIRKDLLLSELAWLFLTFSQKYYKLDSKINMDIIKKLVQLYKVENTKMSRDELRYMFNFMRVRLIRSCETILYMNKNNFDAKCSNILSYNIDTLQQIANNA